jgi:hypothetical protein
MTSNIQNATKTLFGKLFPCSGANVVFFCNDFFRNAKSRLTLKLGIVAFCWKTNIHILAKTLAKMRKNAKIRGQTQNMFSKLLLLRTTESTTLPQVPR